ALQRRAKRKAWTQRKHLIPGLIGAEHRVRTGDLRLGNEPARHSRFSPTLHESPRTFDFLRVYGARFRARLHESSRGFSSFMCPACARTLVSGVVGPATERRPSRRTARLLRCARL